MTQPATPPPPLTFNDLRLASLLYKPMTTAAATAELMELANLLPVRALEDFVDGKGIEITTRLLRQNGKREQLARTLAGLVIHIDKFAALNQIDLAAAIRQRFEEEIKHDVERERSGS